MDKINEIFIGNLQKRLDELKWKIPQLADATKLSASGLYGVLDGSRWPGPDNVERIANALGRPVWWFFSDGKPVNSTPAEALAILADTLARQGAELERAEARVREMEAKPALKAAEDEFLARVAKLGPEQRAMLEGPLQIAEKKAEETSAARPKKGRAR